MTFAGTCTMKWKLITKMSRTRGGSLVLSLSNIEIK